MSRYIDANKFETFAYTKTEGRPDTFDEGVQFVLEKLDEAPTADVEPVRHGHFERVDNRCFRCVLCQGCRKYASNYCPNCGVAATLQGKRQEIFGGNWSFPISPHLFRHTGEIEK